MDYFIHIELQFFGFSSACLLIGLRTRIKCSSIAHKTVQFEQTLMFICTGEASTHMPRQDAPACNIPG